MPERKNAILDNPLPALNDREGGSIPESLPPVIDAHVHVFPQGVFSALWKWFDTHAWPVRYRMNARDLIGFLLERGISHVIALQYAHKPGIAEGLNRFMADLCMAYPGRLTGLAAVFPGETDAAGILERAFEAGLAGVKLHAHVQCFDLNSECMDEIYTTCSTARKPLVIHAGREPKSPAYACDPYDICGVDKVSRVLYLYPELKLCVPHLGADEFEQYARLIESAGNLWLDTAMAVTDYLPLENSIALSKMRADRVMYGSDFPNIPYAWDRELKELAAYGLSDFRLERILWKNACEFFGIQINDKRKQ
ncbi:MAG: amidohydrolase [Desulfobacteraceae bacterium]|nr:amidohydrolase [Desulfobacteraceae bacterium]